MFKKKLTEVAVDSLTDYLKERLEQLKQLDLDKDGVKDVDQIIAILHRGGNALKDCLDSTDFPKIAAGLESIMNGALMIRDSMDAEKLQALGSELKQGATKLAELSQLGIAEMKNQQGHQN